MLKIDTELLGSALMFQHFSFGIFTSKTIVLYYKSIVLYLVLYLILNEPKSYREAYIFMEQHFLKINSWKLFLEKSNDIKHLMHVMFAILSE